MSYRIVIQTKRNPRADEFEVASEAEAHEVALAQSQCDGQRTWKFVIYKGDKRLTFFRGGAEGAKGPGRPRPPQPDVTLLAARKSYFVVLRSHFGAHRGTEPMDSEAAAVAFTEKKWKEPTFKQVTFHVYETFPSGQQHLLGRYRRGRRLKA